MAPPDAADPMLDEIAARVAAGDRIVVVHGGGPHIDLALAERSVSGVRVGGLRVTDATILGVTESVLCGTVNKSLVRALHRRGVRAAGVSGQDGRLIVADFAAPVEGISIGFVGDIVAVHPAVIEGLFCADLIPVIAPLGISADGMTAFNVNADTAAGAIAGALGADAYVIVTNVDRVRRNVDDPASGIARLTSADARRYLADGTFTGGMRPKILSALDALARGASRAVIGGTGPSALAAALNGDGTTLVGE